MDLNEFVEYMINSLINQSVMDKENQWVHFPKD